MYADKIKRKTKAPVHEQWLAWLKPNLCDCSHESL